MPEVLFLATPAVLHAHARKLWVTGLGVNQDKTARSFLVMQTVQEQNQDKPPILCRSTSGGTPSYRRILLISASVLDLTIPGLHNPRSYKISLISFGFPTKPGTIIVSPERGQGLMRPLRGTVRCLPLSCLLAICRKLPQLLCCLIRRWIVFFLEQVRSDSFLFSLVLVKKLFKNYYHYISLVLLNLSP